MDDVDFTQKVGDPPPPTRPSRGVWLERLAPLIADYPGEWVQIAAGDSKKIENMASSLRSNRYKIPSGKWKFSTRRFGDGQGGLWGRYDGPDDDPSEPDTTGDSIDDRGVVRRIEGEAAVDDPTDEPVADASLV